MKTLARKRPREIGLRKELQRERDKKPPVEELTFGDRIAMEINEGRDFWLEKLNFHVDKILEKANRDNKLQNKMPIHYYTRNHVAKVEIKLLKEKLKETLISQEGKGKLYFLVGASIIA